MSGCRPFEIEVDDDLEALLERVQAEASKQGVQFSGDTTEGRFSGLGVQGTYTVEDKIITINITCIGFPASMMHNCGSLEQEIRRFFGG